MSSDKIFEVVMPQMGESITEATIVKWLKRPGDSVEEGENLLEISTEKVSAEIPAGEGGTLVEALYGVDDTVDVGVVIARIAPAGVQAEVKAGVGGGSPQKSAPAEEKPAPAAPKAEAKPSLPPPAKGSRPTAASILGPVARRNGNSEAIEQERGELLRRRGTPLVRNIAADLGVDLAKVEGSGVHGRVTKKDLTAYLEGGQQAKETPKAAPAPAPAKAAKPAQPKPAFEGADEKREPLSRIRRIIAEHMVASVQTSPHAYTVFEADLTRVERLRKSVKQRYYDQHGVRLTPLAFVLAAVAEALPSFPALNASIQGDEVVYHRHINIGVAVALGDEGLIVPVVTNVENLSLLGIARALNDIGDRARAKRLTPEDTAGGTFTVTSPGQMGALMGTPIINQPQSAILHFGAVQKRPAVVEGPDGEDLIAVRSKACLTLGLDHRLIDGWVADSFMAAVRDRLETGDFQTA